MKDTDAAVQGLDKEVKRIGENLKARDDKIDGKLKKNKADVFEEIREREMRKKNAILYRVDEHENEEASGGERREWDRKLCLEILTTLRMGLEESDIKFCRRLGEKGREPRPLCIGFFSEADRDRLLRRGRELEKTRFKEVSICPDLTWMQREEETELRKEAERRNEQELTEEDTAKNLIWAVVGGKGQRRLVKTTAREQYSSHQSQRGRGASQMPRGTQRGPYPRGGQQHYPINSRRQTMAEDQRKGQRRRRSENEEMEEECGAPLAKK